MSLQMSKGRKPISHLIQDLEDGVISDGERDYLMDCMRNSDEVRKLYLQHTKMAALLQEAAESRAQMGEIPISQERLHHEKRRSRFSTVLTGMAAILIAGVGFMFFYGPGLPSGSTAPSGVVSMEAARDASYSVGYTGGGERNGQRLLPGDRMNLSTGLLKLTFDSGVEALIEGPCDLEIVSASELSMSGGHGWFRVPDGAEGFAVQTSHTRVIDYGTEFGVRFDEKNELQVHVAKGLVGVDPSEAGIEEIRLKGGEALSVDESGNTRSVPLQVEMFRTRFSDRWDYIHWSFDELVGNEFAADGPIADVVDGTARLKSSKGMPNSNILSRSLTQGVMGNALSMHGDGVYAETGYAGIGSNVPRTVAAWVRHRGSLPRLSEDVVWPGTIENVKSGELVAGSKVPQGKQGFIAGYTNSGLVSSQSAITEPIRAGVTYTLSLQAATLVTETSGTYCMEFITYGPHVTDEARADCRQRPGARANGEKLMMKKLGEFTAAQSPIQVEMSFSAKEGSAFVGKYLAVRLLKVNGPVIYDDIQLTVKDEAGDVAPRVLLTEDFEAPRVRGFALGEVPTNQWVRSKVGYGSDICGLYNEGDLKEAPYLAWGHSNLGSMWALSVEGRGNLEWGVDMGRASLSAPSSIDRAAADQWNHVACVYTGRADVQGVPEILYYLNGKRVQGKSVAHGFRSSSAVVDTDILTDSSMSLTFGKAHNDVSTTAKGDLDEVYVVRGVMSEGQIQGLMRGEHP